MARLKLTETKPLEPRGSKDPRVQFVPVPRARPLMTVYVHEVHPEQLDGAIVWIVPCPGDTDELLERARQDFAHHAYAVRVLPRGDEDVDLPAAAGTPAQESHVSEVRPVVAELIAELPEELRADVAAFVERELSEANL